MAKNDSVRTISTLTRATSATDSDLIWVSQDAGDGGYASRSMSLKKVSDYANAIVFDKVTDEYGLKGKNVASIDGRLRAVEDGDITIGGQKTFAKAPLLANSAISRTLAGIKSNAFTVRSDVEKIVSNGTSFIGGTSTIGCDPDNDKQWTKEDDGLLVWRIPDGKTDSTQYVDEYGMQQSGGVVCRKTGNLIAYGWFADCGDALPQESWVALYGKITTENGPKWTILQLQPWAVSERSRVAQYVGFNIPVKDGLALKVKTGFRVNASATGFGSGNSLVFPNIQHNVLVGYIA